MWNIHEGKDQKNWILATNSAFVIPISLQPNYVKLWYFKVRLFDLIKFIVGNF